MGKQMGEFTSMQTFAMRTFAVGTSAAQTNATAPRMCLKLLF
jgi:hypothetical protein